LGEIQKVEAVVISGNGMLWKKSKCIKKKKDLVNLVLGESIKLHEILELVGSVVPGHFSRKRMGGCTLNVFGRNFKPVVGFTLTRGWMVSIF
jgi:hypothetical protein